MRDALRQWTLRNAPQVIAWRWTAREWMRGEDWLDSDATQREGPGQQELAEYFNDVVKAGPFRGMRLSVSAICSARWPKLAGCYESELHDAVSFCTGRGHRVLVNVGAAEGYYAIGLARLCPEMTVIAVDPLARARRRLQQVATENEVDSRVSTRSWASCHRIDRWLSGGGLVIMDCEGAELGLLDPKRSPNLAYADILVEIHDFAYEGLTSELSQRLEPTHHVRIIEQERSKNDELNLSDLPSALRERCPRRTTPQAATLGTLRSAQVAHRELELVRTRSQHPQLDPSGSLLEQPDLARRSAR